MRTLELPGGLSPREQGRAHGEAFRPLVREVAAIRTELCIRNGRFESVAGVRDAARAHLPVLERFDGPLHAELEGIAEGAGVERADVVVLNHYTDLKDLQPGAVVHEAEEECSAAYARSAAGSWLGQTWDMHGSAAPYVMMLRVPPRNGIPGAWLLTITGCLGMTGLNEAGLGVAINNLRSTDARIGVVWPALVRRVLGERTPERGRDVVLEAPLGSGHHYLVASGSGAFGLETSGAHRSVVYRGNEETFVHTNHCLDPEVSACTTVPPEGTTHARYACLSRAVDGADVLDRTALWQALGSHEDYPRAVCTHMAGSERPHAMSTCGAVVMDLRKPDVWAAPGCIHRARPHRFGFDRG